MSRDLQTWRTDQHETERTPADEAFEAFLAEISPDQARLDLAPHTEVELRHLARTRRSAA